MNVSVVVIKGKIEEPREWYTRAMKSDLQWEFSNEKGYHLGDVYIIEETSNMVVFQDFSGTKFFSWETSSWITLADGKELIYGYYDEDNCDAEFVHIKDGKCIRDYREYESEVDTDEGDTLEFYSWVDVATYVDNNMLTFDNEEDEDDECE